MNELRRKFLQKTALASGALLLAKPMQTLAAAAVKNKTLNNYVNSVDIVHSSDLRGGTATHTAAAGTESLVANQAAVLLDAGNFFNPAASFASNKKVLTDMLAAGYAAAAIGANDLRLGAGELARLAVTTDIPLLNANYQFADPLLATAIRPYHIIRTGRFKIGITAVAEAYTGAEVTATHDPYAAAEAVAATLRNDDGCDLVICLSPFAEKSAAGIFSNEELAKSSSNIQVIISSRGKSAGAGTVVLKNAPGYDVMLSYGAADSLVSKKLSYRFAGNDVNHFATGTV